MKIFLFALLIVSGYTGFGQVDAFYKVKVDCDMQLNFYNTTSYKAVLHFNSTQSLFEYKEIQLEDIIKENNSGKIKEEEDGNLSFNIAMKDTTGYYCRFDKFKNETIEFVKGFSQNEFYYIIENIPAIEWILSEEVKIIDNYTCNKANCNFRGRKYTVWFTPDIQTSFGPLKLNGLPGLILELSDDAKEVVLNVNAISNENKLIETDTSKYKNISREDYKIIKKEGIESIEEIAKQVTSKMGRGMKINVKTTGVKSIEMD